MLTLYGVPPTRAVPPIWLLNELGLDCEIVSIFPFDEESTRAVKAIRPVGLVPYLVDGGITVSESVAIIVASGRSARRRAVRAQRRCGPRSDEPVELLPRHRDRAAALAR